MCVRIATTKNTRQSTTHDTVLIKTEIYYHQKEHTTPPGVKIYTPGKEPRELLKKNSARSHVYEGG